MMPPEVRAALEAQRRGAAHRMQSRTRSTADPNSENNLPDMVETNTGEANQAAANPAGANPVSPSTLRNSEVTLPRHQREWEQTILQHRRQALRNYETRHLSTGYSRYIGRGNQIHARTTSGVTTAQNEIVHTHAHPMPPPAVVERIATASSNTQTTTTSSNTPSLPPVSTALGYTTPSSIVNAEANAATLPAAQAAATAELRSWIDDLPDHPSRHPSSNPTPISADSPSRRPVTTAPAQAPVTPSRRPPETYRHPFGGNYHPRRGARQGGQTTQTPTARTRYQEVIRRRIEERRQAELADIDSEPRPEAHQQPLTPRAPTPQEHGHNPRHRNGVVGAAQARHRNPTRSEMVDTVRPGEATLEQLVNERNHDSYTQPHSEHVEDAATENEIAQAIREAREAHPDWIREAFEAQATRVLRQAHPNLNDDTINHPNPGQLLSTAGPLHDHHDYFTFPDLTTRTIPPMPPLGPLDPSVRRSWAERRRDEQAEERRREAARGLNTARYVDRDNRRRDVLALRHQPPFSPPPAGLRSEDFEEFAASLPAGEDPPNPLEWETMLHVSTRTTARDSWAVRRRAQQQAERERERNRGAEVGPEGVNRSETLWMAAALRPYSSGSEDEETAVDGMETGVQRRVRVRNEIAERLHSDEEAWRRELDDAMMRDQEWEDMSRIVRRRGLGVTGPMREEPAIL